MTEHDDTVSRRYRELGGEEPPAALDAAILAASRRAVNARPGRHWAGPLSIAAVLLLGIGLSLRMQMEQPGLETSVPSSEPYIPPPAPAVAPATPRSEPIAPALAPTAKQVPPLGRERSADTTAKRRASAPPAAEAPAASLSEPSAAPLSGPSAAAARSKFPPPDGMREEAASSNAPELRTQPTTGEGERDRSLQRIARLRSEGRHAEADAALEEFRRRHPGYRIPEGMWEQVKPR